MDDKTSPDFGSNLMKNILTDWIEPEVKRRQIIRELPQEPFGLNEGQVLFPLDKPVIIRLNKEVKYIPNGNSIRLVDEEMAYGHMTIFLRNGKHNIAFDFRYNRDKSKDKIDLANQFISAAEHSLERNSINAVVENLFSVYEQIAVSFLVQSPHVVIGKTHGTVSSLINKHMVAYQNFDNRFIEYFNLISKLRPKARYEKLDAKQYN